jgi:hypothetical protein
MTRGVNAVPEGVERERSWSGCGTPKAANRASEKILFRKSDFVADLRGGSKIRWLKFQKRK